MTKQELHKDFGNWIHQHGYEELPHRVGVYRGPGVDVIIIDQLKEKYLSHLENLLQDYE